MITPGTEISGQVPAFSTDQTAPKDSSKIAGETVTCSANSNMNIMAEELIFDDIKIFYKQICPIYNHKNAGSSPVKSEGGLSVPNDR